MPVALALAVERLNACSSASVTKSSDLPQEIEIKSHRASTNASIPCTNPSDELREKAVTIVQFGPQKLQAISSNSTSVWAPCTPSGEFVAPSTSNRSIFGRLLTAILAMSQDRSKSV